MSSARTTAGHFAPAATNRASQRDPRIDLARGLALLCIFADHIPGNYLSRLTLQSFGFSDASEVFVLLAGLSAALAYGGQPLAATGGVLRRIFDRALTVYLTHVALVLSVVVGLVLVSRLLTAPDLAVASPVTLFAADPFAAVVGTVTLTLLPEYLDILPLYVVLLGCWLPLFLALAQRSLGGALAASFTLWLAANALSLNLPSQRVNGWYFDPLAWQLLFSIGAAVGLARNRGVALPRSPMLFATALAILALAFAAAAPWTQVPVPALKALRLVAPDFVTSMDKTHLSAWRVVHLLSLFYVAARLVPPQSAWMDARCLQWIRRLGRKSLASYVVVSALSFTGWTYLVLEGSGLSLLNQVVVDVVGIALLIAFASFDLAQIRKALIGAGEDRAALPIRLSSRRPRAVARRASFAFAATLALASPLHAAGQVEHGVVHSKSLGRDVAFTVYLPYSAPPSTKLPLLYLLHGAGGNERSWIDKGHVDAVADRLIAQGRIPRSIIVMPDGGECWWVDSVGCKYESFFWAELEPYVAEAYPVSQGRGGRLIAGASAGGFGALRYALTHPDRFAAAGALSAAVYAEMPPDFSQLRIHSPFVRADGRFDVDTWNGLNYPGQLDRYFKQKSRVALYLASGDQDPYGAAYEAAALHRKMLGATGQSSQLRIANGRHDWDYWSAAIAEALPALFQHTEEFSPLVTGAAPQRPPAGGSPDMPVPHKVSWGRW